MGSCPLTLRPLSTGQGGEHRRGGARYVAQGPGHVSHLHSRQLAGRVRFVCGVGLLQSSRLLPSAHPPPLPPSLYSPRSRSSARFLPSDMDETANMSRDMTEFSLKDLYAIQHIQQEPSPMRTVVNSICPAIYGAEWPSTRNVRTLHEHHHSMSYPAAQGMNWSRQACRWRSLAACRSMSTTRTAFLCAATRTCSLSATLGLARARLDLRLPRPAR